MIQIRLDPQGDSVVLTLSDYLGPELFGVFRGICHEHGARYRPVTRDNVAPVDALPGILASLRDSKLGVEVDDQVRAALDDAAKEAGDLLSAGRERVEAARARLEGTGLALYRYQETGVEWLAPRKRALLCDEMGLGKTVQVLMALPERAAAIVICPAAVQSSWIREALRWRPDLRPEIVRNSSRFRWARPGEILVATYGALPSVEHSAELGPPAGVAYLVADEAHAVKNAKAQRTAKFRAVAKVLIENRCSVWLVTGTPLLNRPPELWNVLQAADLGKAAFGSWNGFCSIFRGEREVAFYGRKRVTSFAWGTPTEEAPERLRRVSLHRRRGQVLPDLPTKTRQDVGVNGLDAATIAACDRALEALGIDWDAEAKVTAATKVGKAAFTELSRARAALATSKIPRLLELVEGYEENDEPLVVFSVHKAPVAALGLREGWATITGETSPEERGRIVERFQAGELRGIAGTVQAMGVGVTLTHAAHALFVDLAWTPALNQQAEDRVCRIGQDRGVIITRMVASHPLDERVLELLTAKQEIIEASIEASAVEADYVHASPAEALAAAAQSAAEVAVDLEARTEEARAEAEERARKEVLDRVRDLKANGVDWDGRDLSIRGKARSAANGVEDRAAAAIVILAAMDPDHAGEKNDVGFSQFDNEFGHSLAEQLGKYGRLSDKQWQAAIKLAIRYRRQTGDPRKTSQFTRDSAGV